MTSKLGVKIKETNDAIKELILRRDIALERVSHIDYSDGIGAMESRLRDAVHQYYQPKIEKLSEQLDILMALWE